MLEQTLLKAIEEASNLLEEYHHANYQVIITKLEQAIYWLEQVKK